MKIIHIITGLQDGGAEGVLFRLCKHDHKNTHIVISLTDEGKYGPLLESAGIKVHTLGMRPGRLSLSGIVKLYKLLRNMQPAVVQTWMYHADLIGGLVAKFARISNVHWGVRHTTLETGLSKRRTIYVARLCALLSKWIPKKIICCAQKALIVHDQLGYAADKLIVINNGYELTQFTPSTEVKERSREKLNIDHGVPLIGLVGRFNPQKDHANFLEAVHLLKKKHANVKCILVGRCINNANKELTVKISKLDLQDTVYLLDQQSDIPELMNALDIHVLSSSFGEAFPNVLAEAMACGTPCVTTDVGDASLIVGSTGWVVPVRDSVALADAIVEALDEKEQQPENWRDRQQQCRDRIVENFSIEKMIQQYHKVWSEALQ